MIYDRIITIAKLPDGVGTVVQAEKLDPLLVVWCGELEVYHRRFWEAVQADSRIDRMVEIPLHRQEADAGNFAVYGDHTYEIVETQFKYNEQNLPVTWLSLKRMAKHYDIAGV